MDSKSNNPLPLVESTDLLGFLRGKLADAEKSLRAREQSEESWRTGSESDWQMAARLSGGKPMKKSERLRQSEIQGRIAVKARHEVAMFKAVIAALDQPNVPSEQPADTNLQR